MRSIKKLSGLLGLALLSSFALVGCSGGDGGAGIVNGPGPGNGGNNGLTTGTFRNVSVIDTNNNNSQCPGFATNGNTQYSCADGETLTINADGTYAMTGIDAGIIGSGTYTVNNNVISFTPNGTPQPVTAEITQNGNQMNLKWTSDIFTGITLVYQKQ